MSYVFVNDWKEYKKGTIVDAAPDEAIAVGSAVRRYAPPAPPAPVADKRGGALVDGEEIKKAAAAVSKDVS